MSEGGGWAAMRERRLAEPGAAEAYDAARLAFDLGGGCGRSDDSAHLDGSVSSAPIRRSRASGWKECGTIAAAQASEAFASLPGPVVVREPTETKPAQLSLNDGAAGRETRT